MKYFNSLTKIKQNELRSEYKKLYHQEYNHSIHLFIAYVCLGIVSIISLLIMFYINKILGIVLFFIFFIMLLINIYFLTKSNLPFYNFLKEKGYEIKKK